MRIHFQNGFHPFQAHLCTPPLHFRRHPPQVNCPTSNVPRFSGLVPRHTMSGISLVGSTPTKVNASTPTTYTEQCMLRHNTNLQ